MSTTTLPRPRQPRPLRIRSSKPLRTLVRGRAEDPAWARPALLALLAATALAYLWNLTASGDANSFYAAAVQAATESWKAFFFGSIDSSSFITVDKPPASLWVMALSGRIFGFSSASMLVPQVLEGVLTVALLAAAVKRWFGAGAGLLAGAALASTPVATLMFRFNNPDALLVLLQVAAAYCLVRALERASLRWMLGLGFLLGFAFLAKMLQAFLVVPGFALVYLVAAPTDLRRRVGHLLAGGAAMTLAAGWWVAIVALWPASSRPMIDGSPDNSIINLIFGYNGLDRLSGSAGPSPFSGNAGLLRLFNDLMGGQASWLLPASLLALVAGVAWRARAPRTDRTRAGLMLWGGWLIVSGLVFSLSGGVIHTYYTVALAPAIAGLVATGATLAWRERQRIGARTLLAVGIAVTSAWAIALLGRTAGWDSWLAPAIGAAGLASAVGMLALGCRQAVRGRRLAPAVVTLALTACLAAPLAYSAQTIGSAHTGAVPSAGPGSADIGGPGGGAAGGGVSGRSTVNAALVHALTAGASGYRWAAATSGSQSAASLELATGGAPVMAIGGFNGQGGNLTLAQFQAYVKAHAIHYYIASTGGGAGAGPGGRAGGAPRFGGPGGGPGSGPSGGGHPGGGAGRVGVAGGAGPRSSTNAITSWVAAHYKSVTIDGQIVYDLSAPKA